MVTAIRKDAGRISRAAGALAGALALAACSTPPQSTRLTAKDFDVTVQQVTASLSRSDFLADRRPDSPPIRIVTRRVENLTSDVLTQGEMWMAVVRVQAALPVQALAQERNVVFQMPPEEIQRLRRDGFESPLGPENMPTHELKAVFRSSTRSGLEKDDKHTDVRKEYYFLEYQVLDLSTREVVWNDAFEFAREARGLMVNWGRPGH